MNLKTERGRKSLDDYLSSTDKFIRLSEYISYSEKMLFKCKTCDYEFWTKPGGIQKGIGCPACLGKVLTVRNLQAKIDQYKKDIKVLAVHGKKGRFSCSCNICNHIWDTQTKVLFRYESGGCPKCSKKLKGSVEKLQEFLNSHDNHATVVGEYINNYTPVACICHKCKQEFKSTPATAMYGAGCPFCCFKGRIPKDGAYLYYIQVETSVGAFWKIGITTKQDILSRYPRAERKFMKVLYSNYFADGKTAYICEKNILTMYKEYLANNVSILYSGNTELFTKDVLQMSHLFNNSANV